MLGHHYECATIKGGKPHGTAYRRPECHHEHAGNVENKRAKAQPEGGRLPPATSRLARRPAKRPTTKSSGRPARPPLATIKAPSSLSSGISKSPWIGRRPPPTSSPANTTLASWARRIAKPASPSSYSAWSTPSPAGDDRGGGP